MQISHQPFKLLKNTFKKHSLNDLGLHIYALADAAQDAKFLKSFVHLRQKCLILEAAGEKAKAVSPHLVQLPQDFSAQEWEWMSKYVAGTSNMTLIVSSLSFDLLFDHLRQFLEVQLDGGLDMFLAFWDPMILATLVGNQEDETLYVKGPVLNEQQAENLLTPIQSWWYWDREQQLQVIFGLNQKFDQLPFIATPLHFSVMQEEQMIEATLPDHLIYYLKQNSAFLINGISEQNLYKFVIETLPEAREYEISGTRDLLNFLCLKLIYKEQFDTDEKLQKSLLELKNKNIVMDEMMANLTQAAI